MSLPPTLFITEKLPWPLDDGGQIRTWHMLQALQRRGPVRVLALEPSAPQSAQALRERGVELHLVPARRSALWKAWSVLRAVFTRRPHPLPKNHSSALLKALRHAIETQGVQALHFNHLDAAQYLEDLGALRSRVHCTVDTHNLLTALYARLAQQARNPLARTYIQLQWQKMAAYEPRLLRQADAVWVCSAAEQAQLRVWGVDRARLVPNGVDTQACAPQARPADQQRRLVFCGGMDYLPNEDGMRWFLAEVWPLVLQQAPDLELLVVGKNPSADLRAGAGSTRVRFTGRVEDVRPFVASGDLSIVPLRMGGGTRLKILESLAMERAVVSTRVGAEGLDLRDGHEILLADTAQDFAAAVLSVLADPARAQALAQAGRALVLARYDWASLTSEL